MHPKTLLKSTLPLLLLLLTAKVHSQSCLQVCSQSKTITVKQPFLVTWNPDAITTVNDSLPLLVALIQPTQLNCGIGGQPIGESDIIWSDYWSNNGSGVILFPSLPITAMVTSGLTLVFSNSTDYLRCYFGITNISLTTIIPPPPQPTPKPTPQQQPLAETPPTPQKPTKQTPQKQPQQQPPQQQQNLTTVGSVLLAIGIILLLIIAILSYYRFRHLVPANLFRRGGANGRFARFKKADQNLDGGDTERSFRLVTRGDRKEDEVVEDEVVEDEGSWGDNMHDVLDLKASPSMKQGDGMRYPPATKRCQNKVVVGEDASWKRVSDILSNISIVESPVRSEGERVKGALLLKSNNKLQLGIQKKRSERCLGGCGHGSLR